MELGILTTEPSEDGKIYITLEVAAECIQKRVTLYDKNGDNHYDTISAFIKSMRGSDPDAAVYYLARMLYAGEDVAFVARRIMICAAEDVGNADPQALTVAVSAAQAVERLGMPEARIPLAQAAIYVACAPKKAMRPIWRSMRRWTGWPVIRANLYRPIYRMPVTAARKISAMASVINMLMIIKNHWVNQQYLPDAVEGHQFYHSGNLGYEAKMKQWLKNLKQEG